MSLIEEMTLTEIQEHLAERYPKGVIICTATDTSYTVKEDEIDVNMEAWCHGALEILPQMVGFVSEYCSEKLMEFAVEEEDDGEDWQNV